MRRTLCALGVAALSLTWSASALADGTTSPGTNSVFVSASGLSLPPGGMPTTLLSGQIKKGKRKTVLAIEAMLAKNGTGAPSGVVAITPTVNGVAVEPSSGGVTFPAKVSCAAIGCFTAGTWWLDIDAAEAAHPGMFVAQPLNIVLVGVESTAINDSPVAATLTARLQKK
jgi:hypothetical protein